MDTPAPAIDPRADRTFHRDSVEFARVANLADAVFAIALTLLVLGLNDATTHSGDIADLLRDTIPNLLAFVLSFTLIANIWWQHHKFFARLHHLDGGAVALTLLLLGLVALVPFPTGLLGTQPTARAAVLCFITIFAALGLVFVASLHHAQHVGAWLFPLSRVTYRWVLAGWSAQGAALLVAFALAFVSPLLALAALAASSAPERLVARRAPADYDDWS